MKTSTLKTNEVTVFPAETLSSEAESNLDTSVLSTGNKANFNLKLAGLPNLGLGLSVREQQLVATSTSWPETDWLEIISEDFMHASSKSREVLQQVAERYPLVMHGVSMSIGSLQPLNKAYLKRLKELADEVKPVWISDHLCWTGMLGSNSHDLLPVLFTEESLKHIIGRVKLVQDFLGRPLILENPRTSLSFRKSTIREWDFLSYLTEETGCGLLLDIANIFTTCHNNGIDPKHYIDSLPKDRIIQIHLEKHALDEQVWDLFRYTYEKTGGVSTVLACDNKKMQHVAYDTEVMKARVCMNGWGTSLLCRH